MLSSNHLVWGFRIQCSAKYSDWYQNYENREYKINTNKLSGVLCKGCEWSDEVHLFPDSAVVRACCQELIEDLCCDCQRASYSTWKPAVFFFFCITPCHHFSFYFFYSAEESCLLRCWQKCLHLNLRNLLCVYVKSLLEFWQGWRTSNMLVLLFNLNSSLHSVNNISCEWIGGFKLELPLFYLSRNLPACLFFLFLPTAAFTLKTIEVIRSNITSLERCHRGADFKCMWVIVPI